MTTDYESLKLFECALLDIHEYPKPDIDTETIPEHIIIAYLDYGERPSLRIYTPDMLVAWWRAAEKYALSHREELLDDYDGDKDLVIIRALTEVHTSWEIEQAMS